MTSSEASSQAEQFLNRFQNRNRFPHLKALRPRQWTKNLVVFAAPLFSFSLDIQSLFSSLLAFALFCCASSSFYLINDVVDVEADRRHPVKCKRPIAAGLISIPVAVSLAISLLAGALILGWLQSSALGASILGYALLQVAYNLRLKRTVILDVVAIAAGFVLRAIAGGVAIGVPLSHWFLLCTGMLALFLAVEKRKAELRLAANKGGSTRAILQRYSPLLLNRMESIVSTVAITSYALWSAGPDLRGASTPWMMLTLPFVLYGIFRYQLLSDPQEIARKNDGVEQGGQTERPEEVLLKDQPMLLTVLGWVLVSFSILLFEHLGVF